jgi:diacylglycerol kinase family enzyme
VALKNHWSACPQQRGAVVISVIENTRAQAFADIGKIEGLQENLAEAGLNVEIQAVSSTEDIDRAVLHASAEGHRVIVAAGGDGTVGAVAARLIGTTHIMGVIPTGTRNHFARDLGVPSDIHAAVEVLKSGVLASIDVAEVNGMPFVNNSGLGLYPRLVEQRERLRRLGSRRLSASIAAAWAVARRVPFLNVRFEVDGLPFTQSTPFVFVGNNRYELEGFRIGRRESLTGGELSVCIAHRQGKWGLLSLAVRALTGTLRQSRDFDVFSAHELWVESDALRLTVSLDGEVADLTPPLHYAIRPGALWVILPQPKDGR